MKQIKVDCPFCLFSSGYTVYTGKDQKCKECNTTGLISKTKYKKAKLIYCDLIR